MSDFLISHEAIRATAIRYAKDFGWHPLPVRGKVPAMGTGWQKRTSSDPEAVRLLFSSDGNFDGLGVRLGPASGIIDIECDSPEAESEFLELCNGEEFFTPTFRSSRGLHRLFAWDDEAEFPEKAVFKIGAIEFRIGGGDAGAQSVFPPSAGREWETSPLDADVAKLPKHIIAKVKERLAESKKPKKQKTESVSLPIFSAGDALNVPRWLASRGREIIATTRGSDGVTRFHIECPNIAAHTTHNASRDCCITQEPSGKLGGCCFHQSCGMSDWEALKNAIGAPTYEDYHGEQACVNDGLDSFVANFGKPKQTIVVSEGEAEEEPIEEPASISIPSECMSPGGLIEEIMDYNAATAIYPRPELALAGALAMMSLITARKVQDRWELRTNAYFVGLCNSGGGKSHAKQVNTRILGALCRHDLVMPKPKSGSGIVSYLKDYPAAILQVDELSDWLETMKNPQKSPHTYEILSLLKELFSEANSPSWKPAAYADAKKNPIVSHPHLTFYGVAPSGQFWQSLTKQNLTDGLVGRLLAIESNGANVSNDEAQKTAPPTALLERVKAWLDFSPGGNLLSTAFPSAVPLQHTEEAWSRYRQHGKQTEKSREGESEEAYALWCRTPEKTGKLAMLRACSRIVPENGRLPVIEIGDVEWAIKLSNWITRNMLTRAGLYVAENQNEANVLRILRMCRQWIARNQLTRRTQFLKARERDEIIRDMVASDRLQERRIGTGGMARTEYKARI